jgi:hypothetical protein
MGCMGDDVRAALWVIQNAAGELGGPLHSLTANAQLVLPLRYEGSVLILPLDPLPLAVHLSSAALTQTASSWSHASLLPCEGQRNEVLEHDRSQLRDATPSLWTTEILQDALVDGTLVGD